MRSSEQRTRRRCWIELVTLRDYVGTFIVVILMGLALIALTSCGRDDTEYHDYPDEQPVYVVVWTPTSVVSQ